MESFAGENTFARANGGRRARVLLGEDDPLLRERLIDRLTADGYEVVALQNGAEVIGVLCRITARPRLAPDVVVMDVRMPFASGVEILASMRAAAWSLPVVIVGPAGDPALEERVARLGGVYTVSGPGVAGALADAVRRACGVHTRAWRVPRMTTQEGRAHGVLVAGS
jgi:DNA-binding response OmpR family regulator